MAIDKKLIKYATKSRFTTDLGNNLIPNSAVVYIIDTKELWTHGTYFGGFYTDVNTNYTTLTIGGTAVNLSKYGHTHVYTELTGSTTTANQAIVSNGITNGWTLKSLGDRAFDSTAYLPLTGGTLSGDLHLLGINAGTIIKNFNYNSSDYARPILSWNQDGSTEMGSIGFYGMANNSYGYLYISPKAVGYDGLNFRVNQTGVSWGTNTIWHAGNDGSGSGLDADLLDGLHSTSFFRNLGFTASPGVDANTQVENNIDFTYGNNAPLSGPIANFSCSGYGFQLLSNNGTISTLAFRGHGDGAFRNWKTIAFTDDIASTYLPLTGGTLTGNLSIQTGIDNKIILNNTDGEKYSKIVFQESGVEYAYILATNGNLQLYGIGNLLYNSNKVITSSNYSTYSLPLTGGTLSGPIYLNISQSDAVGLTVNSTNSTDFGIRFCLSGANKGWVGYIHSRGTQIYNYTCAKSINIDDSGKCYAAGNEILSLGNYSTYVLSLTGGSMSNTNLVTNLNADMLDGLHVGSIFHKQSALSNNVDMNTLYDTGYYFNKTGEGTGNSNQFSYYGQVWVVNDNYYSVTQLAYSHDGYMASRIKWGTANFTDWKTIAFTDSNVASATKLQTARSIWGQTFNGTADISGDFSLSKTQAKLQVSNGTHQFGLYASQNVGVYDFTNANWVLGFDNTNTWLNHGNVGIGVIPLYKLHVAGTLGVTDTLTITSSANNKLYLNDTAGASNNGIFFQNNGTQYAQVLPTSTAFNLRGSGDLLYNGINVLTTSNYSSYALPIAGGKLTGNLGIGVTPTHALHVSGDSYFDGDMTLSSHNLTIYYGASSPKAIKFIGDFSGSYWTAAIVADYWGDTYNSSVHHGMSFIGGRSSFDNFRFYTSSYAELMAIYQDGTVGIGTNLGDVNTAGYKLKVAGTSNFTGAMTVGSTITATGNITAPAFYQSSDIRLKNILEPLDCTLEDIASIPTLYYELKSNPNKVEIGTIAQELLDKFPQLVDVDNNGYYKVEYSKLAIIAIKGIKLLLDELNKLKQIK